MLAANVPWSSGVHVDVKVQGGWGVGVGSRYGPVVRMPASHQVGPGSILGPGASFLKAPETFRARKTIFCYLYLKNREAYRPETLYEGNLCSY